MENVVDIARNRRVIRIIIRAVQHHAAILQHLQQLVHLHRVQLAYLVQEQYAAMRPAHRSRLGLRNPRRAQRPRPLIYRIVNRAH